MVSHSHSSSRDDSKPRFQLSSKFPILRRKKPHLYRPLGPNQFRLLRFKSCDRNRLMSFDLEVHDLEKPPFYYGLSYCWGENYDAQKVLINGETFEISQNLFDCFHQLLTPPMHSPLGLETGLLDEHGQRTATQVPINVDPLREYIWVDQICINQEDTDEKSRQIRLMSSIYASADRTLSWIGKCAPNFGWTVLHVFHRLTLISLHGDAYFQTISRRLAHLSFGTIEAQVALLPSADSAIWDDLGDFLSRPYFQRVWVLQEVLLSKGNPLLLCGNYVFDLMDFCDAASFLRDFYEVQTPVRCVSRFKNALRAVNWTSFIFIKTESLTNMTPRFTLSTLLLCTADHLTSVERDHVFGLLGLLDDKELAGLKSKNITMDYSISTEDLLANVVRHCIDSDDKLRILSIARGLVGRPEWPAYSDPSPKRSTWLPMFENSSDFLILPSAHEFSVRDDDVIHYVAATDFDASLGVKAQLMPTENLQELKLRGIKVRVVRNTVSGTMSSEVFFTDCTVKMWEDAMVLAKVTYASAEEDLKVFGKKLLRACHPTTLSSPETKLLEYELGDQCWKDAFADLIQCYKDLPYMQTTSFPGLPITDGASVENRATAWDSLPEKIRIMYSKWAEGGTVSVDVINSNHIFYQFGKVLFDAEGTEDFGCGPWPTRSGDEVWVLFGGHYPYLLRPVGDSKYLYLGEVSVREFMNGQAIDAWQKGQLQAEWVTLV